jgi:hypothetical protein
VCMAHSGLPTLHDIPEESTSEDDSASSDGGSSGFPISRECNVVIMAIPIATTPLLEGPLMLMAIRTVPQSTAMPQPNTGLLPKHLRACQEEQQCIQQADAEHRTMQGRGKLIGERAGIEAQQAELHHRRSTLRTEQAVMINHEEVSSPAFTRASQNIATVAALLDTLPAPSTDKVDKCQCFFALAKYGVLKITCSSSEVVL